MTNSSAPTLRQSSLSYSDEVPKAVSGIVLRALQSFGVSWCVHPTHTDHGGYPACLVTLDQWVPVHQALRDKAGFNLLRDHTAVDYPDRTPRFTVVSLPVNLSTQEQLIVKTRASEGEAVPTLSGLWKSADWAERETFDMFGIPFSDHPDLTRIYMPQDYDGWPMRRDFPLQGHLRFQD